MKLKLATSAQPNAELLARSASKIALLRLHTLTLQKNNVTDQPSDYGEVISKISVQMTAPACKGDSGSETLGNIDERQCWWHLHGISRLFGVHVRVRGNSNF